MLCRNACVHCAKPSPGLSTVHDHKDGSSGMVRVKNPKPSNSASACM